MNAMIVLTTSPGYINKVSSNFETGINLASHNFVWGHTCELKANYCCEFVLVKMLRIISEQIEFH